MGQRAPRLRPDQLLADSITRVGRFAKIDPRTGRKLPSLIHVTAALAWLGLVAECFRRARAAAKAPDEASPRPDDDRGAAQVRTVGDHIAGPGAGA